ncbi:M20/M25/M40 family metallo-hydrolase [Aeromicrobium endophyticum]|uniref:M20/M25/M40 family metallo-hydrolase n=2 Tax=Aeromicrobium endophyticum TaxID=2292704 RepID=A0A371PDL1_9ACTN|nr:M20/M25/M40 family metallo-hydrolase [Aeromicrobium endophyticum]
MPLPLPLDIASLTMGLVNIGSASGDEGPIADSIEQALRTQPHLTVERFGGTVVARTALGHPERVLLAGHLDTVAGAGDPVAYVEMGKLFGLGACDMKGGLAAMLKAATLGTYGRDATFVFHDGGEAADGPSGLDRLAEQRPDLLEADLAIVLEPTDARVEFADGDLDTPAVAELLALVEPEPVRAAGRSGAARLERLGLTALTFGPGDPRLAHTEHEHVPTAQLAACEHVVRELLRA